MTTTRFHDEKAALRKVRRILIGVSLTASDARVISAGIGLARALGARVHILHSVWPTVLGMSGVDFESLVDHQRAEMMPLLEELKSAHDREGEPEGEGLPGARPEITSGIDVGAPYASILRVAGEIGADLIVVGAAERAGRRLGSTVEKILRKATCPILVVREPLSLPLGRVLAPIDLSQLSADSFRCGLAFLHHLGDAGGADIEALFVLDELQRRMGGQFTAEQVDRFAAEELSRFVDENAGESYRPRVREALRVGDARHAILDAAKERNPDLILLGTHGRGGLERALIGSVTSEVVAAAECNVLVIPPEVAFGAEIADAILEQTQP